MVLFTRAAWAGQPKLPKHHQKKRKKKPDPKTTWRKTQFWLFRNNAVKEKPISIAKKSRGGVELF